ncbi:DUF6949 family protein [Rhizobium alvei]|uniref:Transmembrane protein n=1 Tax=Rhizobium alvei TaxID=1132659 RepID=A0ABT8YR77_9HYPH|nr:hypothetical protein [Rhizobium alvei]MDO6965843.1 hypothetical protein [Rhizobium alvei]
MNSGDVFVSLVVGFAVPLAIADLAKALLDQRLPVQSNSIQLERRFVVWFLALIAGPGFLVDRLAEVWREGKVSRQDLACGVIVAFGWAWIYGLVVLGFVRKIELL